MKKNYLFIIVVLVTACFYGQTVDIDETSPQKSEEIRDFKIYPNPVVNGIVYIQTLSDSDKKVQLFNILGKEVLNITLKGQELNLSKFDPGVYILKVFEKGNTSIRKLVVK